MQALAEAATNFNDLRGLQSINALGRKDPGAALEQVARQFESFMVAQMLKSMRAATSVFADDNPLNSNEMQFRQDMLDQQLSLSLTAGKGLGLATVFGRQMRQQLGIEKHSANDGQLDQSGLETRRVDRAEALAFSAVPPVVRNALRIIKPVINEISERVTGAFTDKQSFVQALLPEARHAAEKLGVDHRVLIAQAALETGWGQSVIRDGAGRSSNNLFNIKAGSFWKGDSVGVTTLEFSQGIPRPQRARFRAYESYSDSFADYVRLLSENGRYRRALDNASNPARFLLGLQQAGYATDPSYARKILGLLRDSAIAGAP